MAIQANFQVIAPWVPIWTLTGESAWITYLECRYIHSIHSSNIAHTHSKAAGYFFQLLPNSIPIVPQVGKGAFSKIKLPTSTDLKKQADATLRSSNSILSRQPRSIHNFVPWMKNCLQRFNIQIQFVWLPADDCSPVVWFLIRIDQCTVKHLMCHV